MFKALKKGQQPSNAKGTLTALWTKKAAGSKEEAGAGDTPGPALTKSQPAEPAAELTPAAAVKPDAAKQAGAEAAARQGAAPLTGGDVAIAAVPEPSPEPAAASAVAAAAAAAEAADAGGQASPGADTSAHPGLTAAADGTTATPAAAAAPAATAAAPPPASSAPASGSAAAGTSGKKRKRSGPPSLEAGWTEAQLAGLQELFAQNEYPSTSAKAALAAQIGLEPEKVNKWFEKQRKKVREDTGTAPKRGRPKSSGSAAAAPAAAAPAIAPAAASGGEGAQENAMEVDEEVPEAEAVEPAAGAAEPTAHQGQEAGLTAAPEAQAIQADAAPAPEADAAQPMAVDDARTPAAAAKPAEAAGAADAGAATKPAEAAFAHAESVPAKTPASTAPPPRLVSAEEKAALIAELEAEVAALQQGGLAQPVHPLPSSGAEAEAGAGSIERQAFSDARLAALVAGQRMPLSRLVAALLPLFREPEGEASLQESVLRSRIIDLAARKSHGAKEGQGSKDGSSGLVDALEDDAPSRLWQWELRDQKHLPKELRPAAHAAKKRAARVQERLGAASAVLRLLRAHAEAKPAAAKLCKALDALQNVKALAQIEQDQQAEQEAAAAKAAAKKQAASTSRAPALTAEEKARQKAEKEAAKEAEKAAKEAEKERLKAEKEAEKERSKAEKEAEKERSKAEKEAEKERHRAEKEAERERKAREAEDKKLVKKTGFKDAGTLKKSANMFKAFFQKAAPAPSHTAGNGDSSPDRASSQQQSQQGGTCSQRQGGGEAGTASKREKGYDELFLKPQGTSLRILPPQPSAAESMDAAASQHFSFERAQAEWQQLLQALKQRRREAAAQPRLLGLPPSWARKPNAVEVAQAHEKKLEESGVDRASVRTYRRKFIWFPADSKRPAYYGSCAPSPAVRPRRFLARDDALDYEVMSDQEWEEEPEGSSLSNAEDESEMAGGEEQEEEDTSFICADGYLSEDEGVRVDDLDDVEADSIEELPEGAAAAAGIDAQRMLSMQQLETQMERARRAGKPLIISRLCGAGAAGTQHAGGFLHGDASLLGALAAEVLLPGMRVGLPADLTAEPAAGAPASAAKAASPTVPAGGDPGKPSVGRPRGERPNDLLPDLLRMVQAAPQLVKNKITEQFLAAHPARKIPKKWVADMLKDHAEWKGTITGWALKPAALAVLAGAPAAPATGATAAAVAAPGEGAAQLEGGAVAVPAGGVQPTPAATKAAPAVGALDRFFSKGASGTPAVPSALRPNAPPSEMKAPERLVTTTAAGASAAAASAAQEAAPAAPLVVPESVSGTADPFWRDLLQHIEAADSAAAGISRSTSGAPEDGKQGQDEQQGQGRPSFAAAFQPATLARLVAGMPASILSALLTSLAAPSSMLASRAAYLRCLEAAVLALAAAEAEAAGDNLSASQQVWAPRGAPVAASLLELCREPLLMPSLAGCVEAGRDAAAGSAEAEAAQVATAVASALLGSEKCRAALESAAAAADASGSSRSSGGSSTQEQLAALLAAVGEQGEAPVPMET